MLVDVHAHLDDRAFEPDRDEVIQKIKETGMLVINAGSDVDTSLFSIELSQKHDFIYACAGVHPHEAARAPENYLEILNRMSGEKKVVAIGEIGLDFYYNFSDRETQKRVFSEQLALARELGLPVVVHDREAHRDTLEILQKSGVERGLMHCYSGSCEMAEEFMKLGFCFSFGGVITFKNARKPREVAAFLPLDRILLETDCPYLTPEPYRGKRNDPTKVSLVARALADLKGISEKEVEDATTATAQRLFNI